MRTFLPVLLFTAAAAAQTLEFEAASIKRSQSDRDAYESLRCKGTTCSATNAPVEDFIRAAHGVAVRDIVGPRWISAASLERYDVTAKAADGSTPENRQAMLQHMLATRFALKVHRETRELPVYLLVRLNDSGALGPNLRPAARDCLPRLVCEGTLGGGGTGSYRGAQWSVAFSQVVRGVSAVSDRRVLDRAGLSGAFDFELDYARSSSATDGPAADIFAAVRQLGLKLESSRAPFAVLVVDSISRPTPD